MAWLLYCSRGSAVVTDQPGMEMTPPCTKSVNALQAASEVDSDSALDLKGGQASAIAIQIWSVLLDETH